ncbi:MAG: hypothetical protein GY810_13925 [Aureispira sp.]|nr:hypothetical protein [Aureispira sp.]
MENLKEFIATQQSKIIQLLKDEIRDLDNNRQDFEEHFLWKATEGDNLRQKQETLDKQGKIRYLDPAQEEYHTLYERGLKEHLSYMTRLKEQFEEKFQKLEEDQATISNSVKEKIQLPDIITFVSEAESNQTYHESLVESCSMFDKNYGDEYEAPFIAAIEKLGQEGIESIKVSSEAKLQQLKNCDKKAQQQLVDNAQKEVSDIGRHFSKKINAKTEVFAEVLYDYIDKWHEHQNTPLEIIRPLVKYTELRYKRYSRYSYLATYNLLYTQDVCRLKLLQTKEELSRTQDWEERKNRDEEDFHRKLSDIHDHIRVNQIRLVELQRDHQLKVIETEKNYQLKWIGLKNRTEHTLIKLDNKVRRNLMDDLEVFYKKTKTSLIARTQTPESKSDEL